MAATVPQEVFERPPKLVETGRSSSQSRNFTSGRGGAGNIAQLDSTDASSQATCPSTLETPTIKAPTYTTGRGGSGNMAQNSCALETRKAQDIQAHPRRESFNKTHVGRGGGGNFVKVVTREERPKSALGQRDLGDSSGEETVTKDPKAKGLKGKVMGALGMKS